MIDLTTLTVEAIQAGFRDGAFTCEALVQACLDRIGEYNPHYNAIIFPNPAALEDARAIDRRRAAGEALGPLAGVPIVVKDPMDMVGFPTTAGWRLLCSKTGGIDLMPGTDAPVVARMRAAGCVILGKTNVPVLSASGTHANDSWAGPTINAAAPSMVPGGSSAGSATAVAAAFAVLGLAEETGGSIQNPASAQALVGIKPTFALVPNTGVMPLSSQRDVVGPLARCVRDAALALDVLAGFTIADPKTTASFGHVPAGGYAAGLSTSVLAGKRLGLYGPGWRDMPLSDGTTALYRRAQGELTGAGAVLVDDPFAGSGFSAIGHTIPESDNEFDARGLESVPHDLDNYLKRLGPAAALKSFAEFAAATAAENPFGPGGVLQYLHRLPQFAASLADPSAPPDMSDFAGARTAYLEIVHRVFDEVKLDALVFPQMRTALPALHAGERIHETTVCEINIAGLPGVTVPAGYHDNGAPFCLIFVGRPWSEKLLLSLAYDYEQATGHRRVPALDRG
ncbi:MAG: amidase [Acetobacteraceae bacterium]|nr:amidase [Acetobacteraceae bacterium]